MKINQKTSLKRDLNLVRIWYFLEKVTIYHGNNLNNWMIIETLFYKSIRKLCLNLISIWYSWRSIYLPRKELKYLWMINIILVSYTNHLESYVKTRFKFHVDLWYCWEGIYLLNYWIIIETSFWKLTRKLRRIEIWSRANDNLFRRYLLRK